MKPFRLYHGYGRAEKDEDQRCLPDFKSPWGEEDSSAYICTPGLEQAVNVALTLGQPLLVTGEPGTGKTRLADSIAWYFGLEPLRFYTKTTSTAMDLFYHYDGLRHFQDIQLKKVQPIEKYVTTHALGRAILIANPTE